MYLSTHCIIICHWKAKLSQVLVLALFSYLIDITDLLKNNGEIYSVKCWKVILFNITEVPAFPFTL